MSEKYLIFGATGSIGSSLAEQLKNSGNDIHLIARNESEVSSIAEKLGCSFTVADVLEDGFIEKVKADISEIKGYFQNVGGVNCEPSLKNESKRQGGCPALKSEISKPSNRRFENTGNHRRWCRKPIQIVCGFSSTSLFG